ncbi:hypothetical protein ACLMJK_008122 [Lecanora helva]
MADSTQALGGHFLVDDGALKFTFSCIYWTFLLLAHIIVGCSVASFVWYCVAVLNIIAVFSAWFTGACVTISISYFALSFFLDHQTQPSKSWSQVTQPKMKIVDSSGVEITSEQDLLHENVKNFDDNTSNSDSTVEAVNEAPQEPLYIDLTKNEEADETKLSESEECAENGWIEIYERPKVPYDCDEDPAGLYGGTEVDDRPSLIEFYHQDARTNQNFARMAPTRAELKATEAAKKKPEQNHEASSTRVSPLKRGPASPPAPPASPTKRARNFPEVLSEPAPNASSLQSISKRTRRGKKGKKGIKTKRNANGAKVEKAQASTTTQAEDSEFEKALLASKTLQEQADADYERALRASME